MKIRVRVTQSHINNGIRANTKGCPIYRSLSQKKNFSLYGVGVHYLWLSKTRKVQLPKPALKFIQDFDSYRIVKPFSFTLEVPNED